MSTSGRPSQLSILKQYGHTIAFYVPLEFTNHLSNGISFSDTQIARRRTRLGELIGYGRVSSRSQSLDIQIAALKEAGVKPEHLYLDKASGTKRTGRDALDDLLSRGVRKADTLVVTRLDRLARSTRDLHNISHLIQEKGVGLRVLQQNIDTTTPEGRLFFSVLSAMNCFETEIRKSRQREGIDAALAKGADSPFQGRPASIDHGRILKLSADGLGPAAIAKTMGIARSSVYRYLKQSHSA